MISVERVDEPASFDEEVRRPGEAWLKNNPDRQMPVYWAPYRAHLARGFRNLCGYSAMWTASGTVDHYLSRKYHPHLAHEWHNYRFASAEMNQRKGTLDAEVLDPYEVEDGWFVIVLPSLEVAMVDDRVPVELHGRARLTLRRLANHPSVVDSRACLYQDFLDGDLSFPGLARKIPLLARAVQQRLDQINTAAFDDEQTPLRRFLSGESTFSGLRRDAPRVAVAIEAALRRPDERVRRAGHR